jgi:hypothetical protein
MEASFASRQTNGRIVAVTRRTAEDDAGVPLTHAALFAVQDDGTLDTTFGPPDAGASTDPGPDGGPGLGGGAMELPFAYPLGVFVGANNGITIVGGGGTDVSSTTSLTTLKLVTDGTPDPTFADGGAVLLQNATHFTPRTILPVSDGYYVLGHALSLGNDLVVHLLANGTLDASFGAGGMVRLPVSAQWTALTEVPAASQGGRPSVIVGGMAYAGPIVFARLR